MKNDKKKKFHIWRVTIPAILFFAAVMFSGILTGNRDDFIIYYGIQGFRTMQTAAKILMAVFGGTTVGVAVYEFTRYYRALHAEAKEQAAFEEQNRAYLEAKREDDAYLSASSRLVERMLREELKKYGEGAWGEFSTGIKQAYDQSVQMDKYQDKLSGLLRKNGAERLGDTEEVLDRAEQYLLQNIRKVLNFLEVCDPSSAQGREKVRKSLEDCIRENAGVLQNTEDFLLALTSYLNEQGTGAKDGMASLENYKQILLRQTTAENQEENKILSHV